MHTVENGHKVDRDIFPVMSLNDGQSISLTGHRTVNAPETKIEAVCDRSFAGFAIRYAE